MVADERVARSFGRLDGPVSLETGIRKSRRTRCCQRHAAHSDSSLAALYDSGLMSSDLRKAHQALDRAVDRLYRRSGFASERERVEHLFMLYEKMSAPLKAVMQEKPKRRRGKSK